ncbi:MAG TPA: class I SAM-dependent methyltransferase [Dehalococcoidia bacterium]|nr:class I SAM-dependent methyltransferase [Dehalococcoidia bacterium]
MAEPVPPPVPPVDYVRRWHDIVERRRVQMDNAYEAAGRTSGDYWARRAKQYRQALHDRADADPFFIRVRGAATRETTVLDVGAGTGRHTLALAPHVAHVTAVDPSAAMLGLLREDAAARSLGNITAVESGWMEADAGAHDIVICSHVLYPIADVVPFLRKLTSHARARVFVYLRIDPLPTDMGLWAEFYGEPLQPQPGAHDLLNLLAQIGVMADLEVVQHRFTWTFADLDEAEAQVSNTLCLRDDDAAGREKLRALLERTLVRHENGRIGPDVGSARSAIISWPGEAAAAGG